MIDHDTPFSQQRDNKSIVWDEAIDVAAALGISQRRFWAMTPREFRQRYNSDIRGNSGVLTVPDSFTPQQIETMQQRMGPATQIRVMRSPWYVRAWRRFR